MRLVVFGGSFDPVHLGHEAMADAARAQLQPDRLIWLPAGRAPHKDVGALAPSEARGAWMRLVLAGRPGEELDEREFRRSGPSYTVVSLREMAAEAPGAEILFLLGSDSLAHLPTWRALDEVCALAEFALAPRAGWTGATAQELLARLARTHGLRHRWLRMAEVDLSSTAIRAAVARGERPAGLRAAVLEDLLRRGCYR